MGAGSEVPPLHHDVGEVVGGVGVGQVLEQDLALITLHIHLNNDSLLVDVVQQVQESGGYNGWSHCLNTVISYLPTSTHQPDSP